MQLGFEALAWVRFSSFFFCFYDPSGLGLRTS